MRLKRRLVACEIDETVHKNLCCVCFGSYNKDIGTRSEWHIMLMQKVATRRLYVLTKSSNWLWQIVHPMQVNACMAHAHDGYCSVCVCVCVCVC